MQFDPTTDLEITRLMRASPDQIWRCWTDPALFAQWWAPRPVVTRDVVIDLRPGGRFASVMDVPDHGEMRGEGCFLDVEHGRRIVWTDMMEAGWRPARTEIFGFTTIVTLTPEAGGTRYVARAMHRTREVAARHEAMGFHDGWGTVAAQLEDLAAGLAVAP